MADTYYEIKPQFRWMADYLENETGLQYQFYNAGIQVNVTDRKGGRTFLLPNNRHVHIPSGWQPYRQDGARQELLPVC